MSKLAAFALAVAVIYFATCVIWPYARCPWCRGVRTRSGPSSWFRLRSECWLCGSSRYRRLGARLLGRGRG